LSRFHLPRSSGPILPDPQNVAAGEKFSITHDDRVFEVVAPAGGETGETINIIVSKVKYDDLQSILQAGTAKALELNERYSIMARATELFEQGKAKAEELDAKYSVSVSSVAVAATGLACKALEKAQELSAKYEVVEKVKGAVDRLVVYAIEIDTKYDVRTTAARLVVSGVNAVVSSSLVTPKTLTGTVEPAAAAAPAVAEAEAAVTAE